MSTRLELRAFLIVAGIIVLALAVFLKKGERIKGVAILAAWLVPGAGHVLMGKWKKGLFFFGILAATYLFGMIIAGFRPVSFDDNPFYFVGQYGSGVTLLVAKLRGAEKAILRPEIHPSWFDPGLLYVCVVGLLNLVVMLNILDLKVSTRIPSPVPMTDIPVAADKPPAAAPLAAPVAAPGSESKAPGATP